MEKQLLILLITISCINCYSQITFEKGYYIDNSEQKVDCLIKNMDWKNNPTEFVYKLTENSVKKEATIKTVREFGIYDVSKFIRTNVKIDRSRESISELSYEKNPILKEEELFLKVLVEGKANLYEYLGSNLNRYFYNVENSTIEQLIFKSYKNSENKIAQNNRYKQQLWNDLKCSTLPLNKVENVNYNKNELVSFFIEYNECNNQEFTNFEEKQKKDLFNISVRPGLNYSSLYVSRGVGSTFDTDFGYNLGIRLGVEFEGVMPFNKNKWAIIFEPTYQYYKSEPAIRLYPDSDILLRTRHPKAEYKSIELPIGIRYYFFLNDSSKIFVNASFIFDIPINSKIIFETGKELEIQSVANLGFGIGYKYKDRYSLEMRYQTSREVLYNQINWSSDYKTVGIIFGYTVF